MQPSAVRQWWRDAVVYEVYVRSFADSDGDGVGDLEGIRQHLPYLVELGVDAVWLTPFYPSPMRDHGYDVADYCDVEPVFGDLAGFDRLLADAHDAGLKVIVDVVPNHTSDEHVWFREATADPASPARSRYVFRDGRGEAPPNNWQSIFGGPAWTRESPDGQWYLHLFDAGQPDLDWTNREVHEEFLRVLRFWLDRGVDGFRIDVAHALYKRPDLTDTPEPDPAGLQDMHSSHVWDRDEVLAVYEEWRTLLDSYDGERMLVGEVFLYDVPRIARYVGPTRLHQAFNFTVMKTAWGAAPLRATVELALAHFHPGTWVLSNHDLVRHVTRYGGGPLGRRRGLAVSAALFGLPGSPYLYQGEELGLDEADVPAQLRQDPAFLRSNGERPGRDGCRTPLPWSSDAPGLGFTTGEPWLPFGADAAALAVDLQTGDPGSTLSAYRRLLAARRELLDSGELGDDVELLDTVADVLAYRRGPVTVVLNTATEPVQLPVPGASALLAATAAGAELVDGVVVVPAAATVWLR
ncbi:MAG: alpha-amylase family glycosyl hydrolase [Mycobacteriales bacterium]